MEIGIDIDEASWETYLSACRAENVKPSLSDYAQWLDEQEVDSYEPEW